MMNTYRGLGCIRKLLARNNGIRLKPRLATVTIGPEYKGTWSAIYRSRFLSDADAEYICEEWDPDTKDYIFQQTMFRIKDPRKSLDFYSRVLGMRLLKKMDFPAMKFSLYFMGLENGNDIPKDELQRTQWTFTRKACLELSHNWGTENDPEQRYHNGNMRPQGFGHIGVAVPDVQKACERFEKLGVEFIKKPNDGRMNFMKGLAFIRDPDGYWIEILNADVNAQNERESS